MQLLLPNCSNMAPVMQALNNLVISIFYFHRTVYQSFPLTLNAISRPFKFKSLNHDISLIFSQLLHKNCPKMGSFMQVLLNLETCMNNLHEKVR